MNVAVEWRRAQWDAPPAAHDASLVRRDAPVRPIHRWTTASRASGSDELEDVGVDDVRVDGEGAVGVAGVHLQRAVTEELDRELSRVGDRDDLVVVAVDHQGGDVDRPEVLAEALPL